MARKKKTSAFDEIKKAAKDVIDLNTQPKLIDNIIRPMPLDVKEVEAKEDVPVSKSESQLPTVKEVLADEKFEIALVFSLWIEGGYSNNPKDRGGKTNLGVTQSTYNQYRKIKKLSPRSVKEITKDEAEDCYRQLFFNPSGAASLPLSIACIVFDWAINSGPGRPIMALQSIVGAKVDADYGPDTKSKVEEFIKNHSVDLLFDKLIWKRYNFFNAIVKNNHSQITFLRGWLNRLIKLVMYCQSNYQITDKIKKFDLPKTGYVGVAEVELNKLLKASNG